eukprot:SAG22_NODE_1113_length_5533_cov_5.884063_5_plen_91_part_00
MAKVGPMRRVVSALPIPDLSLVVVKPDKCPGSCKLTAGISITWGLMACSCWLCATHRTSSAACAAVASSFRRQLGSSTIPAVACAGRHCG